MSPCCYHIANLTFAKRSLSDKLTVYINFTGRGRSNLQSAFIRTFVCNNKNNNEDEYCKQNGNNYKKDSFSFSRKRLTNIAGNYCFDNNFIIKKVNLIVHSARRHARNFFSSGISVTNASVVKTIVATETAF